MSILFINSSPNKNGNTAKLAEMLMNGKAYQTLNLVDYKVYGSVPSGALKGRKFVFLFQGAAPEGWMLERS